MELIKEFFGIGGYTRAAEGYMSWQHLTFVSSLMVIMIFCAILFGRKAKRKGAPYNNRVLIAAALLIDGFELVKIVLHCYEAGGIEGLRTVLPLFLCSIQLITIPLAAFSKGRIKEAALDFVFIFGLLGAVLGTYGAGQNYNAYPVLSFTNVVSGITHSISGFASLYIAISGMASMRRRNMWITFSIMLGFAAAATVANFTLDYNYMFLRRGDGTPYDIFYNLVGGHPVLYPIVVVGLFIVYILVFYLIFFLACGRRRAKREAMEACECAEECEATVEIEEIEAEQTEDAAVAVEEVSCETGTTEAVATEQDGIGAWIVKKTPLSQSDVEKIKKLALPVGIACLALFIASKSERYVSEESRNRRFDKWFH